MAEDKKSKNVMLEVAIEKVTLNIGVGQAGAELENAKTLLERLSGCKSVETLAKVRNPVFHIKKGDPIGAKTTLRGQAALEFVKKALKPKDFTLSKRNFDSLGNFSFGVPEYIEFPGAKYDPKIGIIGFDVCVSLKRKGGWRIARKRIRKAKIPNSHRISRDEGIAFAQNALGVKISE
ncbi:50S ribosomal protein L5 [Candidatus Micrarchaeota archaeon CG10_big_fil_rev_8_21_14_0_10_45_29]|nr:MAG: 50S ribosomal protein L5 [Candidatus Micrarchaeota archaeon CG10_big_fil_rev_8_21_14_0_10_45_29]